MYCTLIFYFFCLFIYLFIFLLVVLPKVLEKKKKAFISSLVTETAVGQKACWRVVVAAGGKCRTLRTAGSLTRSRLVSSTFFSPFCVLCGCFLPLLFPPSPSRNTCRSTDQQRELFLLVVVAALVTLRVGPTFTDFQRVHLPADVPQADVKQRASWITNTSTHPQGTANYACCGG
ncbi:hypothetical protein TcYC6_0122460 [Trypanosoma cruzi]|nr:hypothetical protein TcYC6_0122460 [Trypanosoma cruzi]